MENTATPKLGPRYTWVGRIDDAGPMVLYVDALSYADEIRKAALEEAATWIEVNVNLAAKLVEIGKEPFYIPAMETVEGKTIADAIRKLGEQQ